MKVIAATKNKGKIREMQEILAPLDIEIVSQQELGIDVKETFGYITKKTRIDAGLEKTHAIDARCITGNVNVQPIEDLWLKKK